MTLLAVKQLSKSFGGVHAIADLDLQIHEGAVHSIIGPNGAGKTSLINLLAGQPISLPKPASVAHSRTCRCSSI